MTARWWTRTWLVTVLGLTMTMTMAMSGCGSSSDGTATSPFDDEAEVVLHGPGTDLGDGLVVPEGAHLAGTPFDAPDEGADRWTAILTLDRDPFGVFDALADQVRKVVDAPMPGSSDSCYWLSTAGSGKPERIGTDDPSGDDGISCNAIASAAAEGHLVAYEVTLEWNDDEPGYAELTRQPWPADLGPVAEGAQALSIAAWDDGMYSDLAAPTTASVPAAASAHLVMPDDPNVLIGPEAGEPFGPTVHCFARGDARFEAPPGTRGVVALRYQAVLAVDDVSAAIADLKRQLEAPELDRLSETDSAPLVLADGTEISRYSHGISAGGDGCSVQGSADGHHLRVFYSPGG